MKPILNFLKTTFVGGLFILLPLLLLQLMLDEIFQLLVALATPIADLILSKEWVDSLNAPVVLTILLIFVTSFIFGLLAKSKLGQRCGSWLERNTVGRIPLYGVLKSLTAKLIEIGEGSGFKPVMLVSSEGYKEFAYLIEVHGDGFATIMVPWAPTPLSGSVKIVPMKQLEMLDASLGDVTKVLSHWGTGAHALTAARGGNQ
jgi:uncharacterized membrane protein